MPLSRYHPIAFVVIWLLQQHLHRHALEHQLQAILFLFHGVVGQYLALLIANAISAAGHPAGDGSRSVYGEG
ncbi:hypothetical protein DYI26_04470 [Halomonas litopenaei]|nr:hypothetical protein [Halomonas litopenaei]